MQVFVSRWAHESIPHQTHHSTTCRPAVSPQLQRPLPQLPWESGRPIRNKCILNWIEFETVWGRGDGAGDSRSSCCFSMSWQSVGDHLYVNNHCHDESELLTNSNIYESYMTKLSWIIASKRFSSSSTWRACWFKKSIPSVRVLQLHILDVSVAMGAGFLAIICQMFFSQCCGIYPCMQPSMISDSSLINRLNCCGLAAGDGAFPDHCISKAVGGHNWPKLHQIVTLAVKWKTHLFSTGFYG